tara:strand:+ start:57 stop:560 length:504 start_codon:yes stop_codon:yes gene_type:complete
MNKVYTKYIKLAPVFILIQVLILNDVLFFNYINPYFYLALIISWPIKNEKWILLIYSFFLGLSIDLFNGSLGFHSTVTVFTAFVRSNLIKITIPHNILSENDEISQTKVGKKSFITYSFLVILLQHLLIFILEHLSLNFQIIIKVIVSSLVTLALILILEIVKSTKK